MRLSRMTTRRWMIAVAVAGLVMGGIISGVRLTRRRDFFLSRMRYHAAFERWHVQQEPLARHLLREIEQSIEKARHSRSEEPYRTLLEHDRRIVTGLIRTLAYHTAMTRKYRHAARYPWLLVEPDQPPPE